MKSVVDSSVAVKWLVPEPDTPKALRLRADFQAGVLQLIAPDVLPIEVTHALTRAQRQGRVTPAQGRLLFLDMMRGWPVLVPSMALVARAYDLSSQFSVGVYDCLYVALAEQEQCELITADARLVNTFQGVVPFRLLSDLP